MREDTTFSYFLTDNLGLRSVHTRAIFLPWFHQGARGAVVGVADSSGTLVSETRYLPFGETRTDVGLVTQTDFGYTFQRNLLDTGLMDYKARFYDPFLGRFIQPDTLVSTMESSQALNRYAYVNNNPVKYSDPSGHCIDNADGTCYRDPNTKKVVTYIPNQVQQHSYTTSFQMIPVFTPYYYGEAANESYTGFTGGGDSSKNGIPQAAPGSLVGILDDIVIGARPMYYNVFTPYDQIVTVNYLITYPGAPRIDTKKVLTITGLDIQNNESGVVVNYNISISGPGNRKVINTSAGPGDTSSIELPPMAVTLDGIKFKILAQTSCAGPCVRSQSPIVSSGYEIFTFHP